MNQDQLDGVLLVDKAPGMTSHDVVAIVRRCLNTKKVGHCGTLDPLATGLLLIVLGRATKIQDLLMSEDKEYVGTMLLGATTDSQDADGQVLETKDVPDFSQEQIPVENVSVEADISNFIWQRDRLELIVLFDDRSLRGYDLDTGEWREIATLPGDEQGMRWVSCTH